MYKKFYGFQQDPFSVVPNPDFLYLSLFLQMSNNTSATNNSPSF